MKELRRIFVESRSLHSALWVLLVLAIASTFMGLVTPWLYRELVNFLTERSLSSWFAQIIPASEGLAVLLWLAGMYFVIDVARGVLTQLESYLTSITGTRSQTIFAHKTLEKLHQLSIAYFDRTSPGWIRERVFGGIREIFGILRSLIVDITPLIINLVVAAVVLFIFNPTLALVFVVIAPLYIMLSIWRARVMRFWQKKVRTQFERAGKTFFENINYYQLIREFSREDFELSKLDQVNQNLLRIRHRQEYFLRWSGFARELLYALAFIWVYGYGGYLVLAGQLLIGDLILFVAYLNRAIGPLWRVMQIYDSVQVGLVSVSRLFGIWDKQDRIVDLPQAQPLAVTDGAIEFKNVSFAYRGSQKYKGERVVFDNFNLSIKPKEIVALVGPSGVGKSTLVKLLLRFYDTTSGQVLIDHQDIKTATQASLRRNVAVVMQDVVTFNHTIKYNLRYGRPGASDRAVADSTKVANLYDFIMSLRQKFNTKIGVRGVRLSGGEKQRLAIARALLKDAPILVMDEATSALDSENEKKIQDAMWKLIRGRTTLIIAHRLSTVRRADRIVVLDGGQIIEQGTHQKLLKKSGYYRRLFKMQGQISVE